MDQLPNAEIKHQDGTLPIGFTQMIHWLLDVQHFTSVSQVSFSYFYCLFCFWGKPFTDFFTVLVEHRSETSFKYLFLTSECQWPAFSEIILSWVKQLIVTFLTIKKFSTTFDKENKL